MTLMERLRGLDAERLDENEMIELRAGARGLVQEYQDQEYEVPEWLKDRAQLLDRELTARRSDSLRKRLKELDAQDASLRTSEEKRADIKSERARIAAALGQTTTA